MSPWQINRLGKQILQGAVIAYPTDTIWGFGCHPLDPDAVQRILNIKQRPVDKGLILLASSLVDLLPYLKNNLSDREKIRLGRITEQPTTWLVEANPDCPFWLTGEFTTIAVRLTDHPFVRQLCDGIRAPLVSTSANRSGRPTVRNAIQARNQFSAELDFIVGGYTTARTRASKIITLSTDQVIRAN